MRPAILLLLTIKSLCHSSVPRRVQNLCGCIETGLKNLLRGTLHDVSAVFEGVILGGVTSTWQGRIIEQVLLDHFAH